MYLIIPHRLFFPLILSSFTSIGINFQYPQHPVELHNLMYVHDKIPLFAIPNPTPASFIFMLISSFIGRENEQLIPKPLTTPFMFL